MFVKSLSVLAVAAAGFVGAATSASAALILTFGPTTVSTNSPATGASGVVSLSFSDLGSGNVLLSGVVENTTGFPIFGAGATESQLTGFGLDLFGAATIDASTFTGGTYLSSLIAPADADPFGDFDLGIADNTNYNGGNANGALSEGLSDTFSIELVSSLSAFDLEGSILDGLINNLYPATDPGAGLRFQQVNAGAGSDKIANPFVFRDSSVVGEVPLPAAGWMLIAALGGIGAMKRRKG